MKTNDVDKLSGLIESNWKEIEKLLPRATFKRQIGDTEKKHIVKSLFRAQECLLSRAHPEGDGRETLLLPIYYSFQETKALQRIGKLLESQSPNLFKNLECECLEHLTASRDSCSLEALTTAWLASQTILSQDSVPHTHQSLNFDLKQKTPKDNVRNIALEKSILLSPKTLFLTITWVMGLGLAFFLLK